MVCYKRGMKSHRLGVLLACLMVSTGIARTIYVDVDAPGANDGTSWEDAYNYLQDALSEAGSVTAPVLVAVAEGTYRPDQGAGIAAGDRSASFGLVNGVTIRGGYMGYGQSWPNHCDYRVYKTILSGDLAADDVEVDDPCDLAGDSRRSENSYHVVTAEGAAHTAELEGVVITGGNANGIPADGHGGGLLAVHGGPRVSTCTFRANSAGGGGAVYCGGEPVFSSCKFEKNASGGSGGAMYLWGESATLSSCRFEGNSSRHGGGGLMVQQTQVDASDCRFSGNRATEGQGGGIWFDGGGYKLVDCAFKGNSAQRGGGMWNIDCDASESSLTGCVFEDNMAEDGGGGGLGNSNSNPVISDCNFSGNSADYGGGIYSEDGSEVQLGECVFRGNSADSSGGGMYSMRSDVELLYGRFEGNSAGLYGGAICSGEEAEVKVANCIASGNTAANGGGFYNGDDSVSEIRNSLLVSNSAQENGGVIHGSDTSQVKVFNCTFSGNAAGGSGGSACMRNEAEAIVVNCILWGDVPDEIAVFEDSVAEVSFSDLEGGWGGSGNINSDPRFVDAAGGDFHLNADSPCIDAGDNGSAGGKDLDRRRRIIGGQVDMGAYEFNASEFDVIYVDADAPGDNDGSSWANAYRHLQDALADARVSYRPLEIRVAQGLYRPDLGAGVSEGDRGASFVLVGGVVVRGGYAGFGHTQPDLRDIQVFESILSGDLAGDDGAGFANYGENSYNVVRGSSSWRPLDRIALDGFTITGGNADGADWWVEKHGGGISIGDCRATIRNCTIIHNRADYAGGGMHGGGSGGCGSTIEGCRFIGNSSGAKGGGLALDGESGGEITNCLFAGNFSANGGAFYDIESYPDMTNCTFVGNRASVECGGARQYGGGLNFRNCIFWGNTDASGGESAQVISYFWYSPPIEYCCIQDWTGSLGGAGNIDADPCFAEIGYWQDNGTPDDVNDDIWVNGDYHLRSEAARWDASSQSWVADELSSPCIDAGDPMSAVGPEPFPNGGIINMGVHGGTVEASKSYFGEPVCETIVAGDINGDCVVDFLDFRMMAIHWLEENG